MEREWETPIAEERMWALGLGAALVYWRWLLGALVVVLVLTAVTANASPQRQIGQPVGRLMTVAAPTPEHTELTVQGIVAALPVHPGMADAADTVMAYISTPVPAVSSALITRPWQPADECSRLSRPVSAGTMRWCPKFAEYLYRTGDWQPGDLTKLLRTADCESRGVPTAKNPRSSAYGIGQFLDSTWRTWAPRAAAFFGYDNPRRDMPFDQIATMVLLYTRAGPGPWPTCGRR